MDLLRWAGAYEEGFCVIRVPEGIEKTHELSQGISRAAGFPDDAGCRMDPEFPKDVELADNVYGAGLPVISARLTDRLQKEELNQVEFLPIRIINHKGRVASADYRLMNPLEVIDCVDLEKSVVRWNRIDKNRISGCKGLVLAKDSIPPTAVIFRPKHWLNQIFIRRGLAEKLEAEGFTGLYFPRAEGFDGIE